MSDHSEPAGTDPGLFTPGESGMPPWIPRLLLQVTVLAAGIFLALALVRELRSILVLLLVAWFLSTALEPGVKYLHDRGWRRGLATGVLFLAVGAAGLTIVGLMVPILVDQTLNLVESIPGYVDDIGGLADRLGLDVTAEEVSAALSDVAQDLQGIAGNLVGSVFGVGSALLSTVFNLLTIGLFTFYMTADGPRFRRTVLSAFPARRQREILRIWDIAIEKTGGYFYSRLLLAAIAAAATWVALRLIGVPFALPLALWTGVLSQFIPAVGTYIGGALPLLIALLESPLQALWVLAFIIIYQQAENYLLAPRITARTMNLHPAVAFGSAIAGASLLGVAGALIALPAAATIQAFGATYIERHDVVTSELTKTTSPEAETA
jgi:predicted PurR-regulated permease PerM